jgi:uncharacterized protein YvpB
MSKKLLEVPYKSQWDLDASESDNDCGCASVAMCLSYFGKEVSTNEVYINTGEESDDGTNFTQLDNSAKELGFTLVGNSFKALSDLKNLIDLGIPAIVVLHYGFLSGRQDTYTGGHIMVVSGYDDKYIYTEDPDFYKSRRDEGHQKAYPINEFDKAWASILDENNPRNLWYIEPPKGWVYKESISLKEYFGSEDTKAYKEYKQGQKDNKWIDIYDYIKQGGTPNGITNEDDIEEDSNGATISLMDYFGGKTVFYYLYKDGQRDGLWGDIEDYVSKGGTSTGLVNNSSETPVEDPAEEETNTTSETVKKDTIMSIMIKFIKLIFSVLSK